MSTLAFEATENAAAAANDDFAALEQRVLRAIELLKTERAARAEAEAKVAELHQSLEAQTMELLRAESELEAFKHEREQVRGRVERLLGQLDDLSF
jgi:chromosome segregation ATPase